ncbi:hypothetical protein [Streptomyces sp. NPDC051567]|uniref:hypothetical protein n=1 Tax=Streptomyces sp. NPDC051567 TaxID=3365660 RepID=UPI0037912DF9
MTIMKPADFRAVHGDPVTWTAADHDEYLVLSELCPPEYSVAEMAALAVDFGLSAASQQRESDRLTAQGYALAAGIWARGAQDSREHAAAARRGARHFDAFVNGW